MLDAWVGTLPVPARDFLSSGYLAVGTFFVLSGFVLSRSYARATWNRTGLLRYGVARFARIYPVYAVSLAILAPIVYADMVSPRNTRGLAVNAGLLANYGLILQGWSGNLPVHWNTPAWSLSCEWFFYLCFPLALIPLRKAGGRGAAATAAFALSLPVLDRLLCVPGAWKPVLHLGDFLLGVATARIFEATVTRAPRLLHRGPWFYVPSAAISAVLICSPQWSARVLPIDIALPPLNALLLVGLALGGGLPARALSWRPVLFLGKASYSMYILHIPLLWWYSRSQLFLSRRLSLMSRAAVYLAVVVTLSAVVYQLVEEPANRGIRKWAAARLPAR